MTEPVLSFDALQRALARCMEAHPPEGTELRLHADANSLAGLWGLMSYERTASVPLAQVKPSVLEAFGRWSDEGEGRRTSEPLAHVQVQRLNGGDDGL